MFHGIYFEDFITFFFENYFLCVCLTYRKTPLLKFNTVKIRLLKFNTVRIRYGCICINLNNKLSTLKVH